jgi:hypothetical protein
MRKRIAPFTPSNPESANGEWLDLNAFSEVIISSEDPNSPIESALIPGASGGWQASSPGRQTIRIVFEEPQELTHIHLVFREEVLSRTQEFVLRWSAGVAGRLQEIVRQQYNFSPGTVETEDYTVNLKGARVLELEIVPAIDRGDVMASLAELRVRGTALAVG